MCGQDTAAEVPSRKLRTIAQLRCDFWRRRTAELSDNLEPQACDESTEENAFDADDIACEDLSTISSAASLASAEFKQKPKLRNLEELMSRFKQQKQLKPDRSAQDVRHSREALLVVRHVAEGAEVSIRCMEPRELVSLPKAKCDSPDASITTSLKPCVVEDYASTASTAHSEANSSEAGSPRLVPAAATAKKLSADAVPFFPDSSCHNFASCGR